MGACSRDGVCGRGQAYAIAGDMWQVFVACCMV